MTITDSTDSVVTLTDQAVTTVRAMRDHAALVHELWKYNHPEWGAETTLSLTRNLADLMTWRGLRLSRDGDLSLFGQAEGLCFGIIFHAKHYRVSPPQEFTARLHPTAAPYEGIYCMSQDSDSEAGAPGRKSRCAKPYHQGKPTCEGHDVQPFAMPIPGTWSFHS